jgi:beta-lactamase regulating signal transducer with metallopeptidase domain
MVTPAPRNQSQTVPAAGRPAAVAATRVFRASVSLGMLGVAAAVFLVARLMESWRVAPHGSSHHVSIFGQTLSYPVANAGAIVVLFLAVVGLAVTALAVQGAIGELASSRRFQRSIAGRPVQRLDGALVIADATPQAFCAGLFRPRVYLSTAALAVLDDAALGAVLAHERHHAHRRDPLRLATGRVLARALFFLPGLEALVERQQALAELSADESAVAATPSSRSALARAMLSFSDAPANADSVGIDPARIDYLLGEPPSWRFPAVLCVVAAAVIALLLAVGALAGQVASGSATLAPPFLSHQPCVVVLAAVPAAVGILAAFWRRRLSA